MGKEKKGQAPRALISVCMPCAVQCKHQQNPLYPRWWEITRTNTFYMLVHAVVSPEKVCL